MPGYTKKELANLAGYTYQRLYQIDNVLPEKEKLFVKSGDGEKYDLGQFIQRWTAYNVSKAKDGAEEDSLDAVRAAHERVKMEKTQIQLQLMRGEVLKKADVQALWIDIVSMVRQRFLTTADRLSPQLVMIGDIENIKEIIGRDIRDTLTALSESDVPLPEAVAESDEENGEDG